MRKVQSMSGTTGLPPIPLYLSYSNNEASYAANALKSDPTDSALVSYFQSAAPKITTPDGLLGDYKSLQVVLGAFGLGGAIGNTALLRQLLTQDPTQSSSLAQRLGNQKYLAFARALSTWTPPPFSTPAKIASIVSSYQTNTFERQADAQSPGLQNALYFTRTIGSAKTLTQIQADPQLLDVVVTGLGLPPDDFDALDFTQQTAILKSKVDLTQFQNPASVKRFAEQYLIAQQSSQTATAPPPGSVAGLFDESTDSTGDGLLTILDPSSNDTTSGSSGSVLSLFA
jgi:hypothetical protein